MSDDATPMPDKSDKQSAGENVTSGEAAEKTTSLPEVQPAQPAQATQPQPDYYQAGQTPPPPGRYAQPNTQQMPPQPYAAPQTAPKPGNGKTIAALICGIGSIIFCWFPILSLPAGIVAVVLAVQCARAYGKDSRTTAGKITGIFGIVFSVLAIIFMVGMGALFGTFLQEYEKLNPNPDPSLNSSSSSSSSTYVAQSDEEAVRKVADGVAVHVCHFTDSEYEALGAALESELIGGLDVPSSMDMSFTALGINRVDFAKLWVKPISYTITEAKVYKDNEASVEFEFKAADEWDFMDRSEKKILALIDSGKPLNMTESESLKAVGQIFQDALKEADIENKTITVWLKKSGDTWTVEKASYDIMVHSLYGYSFDKPAPSGVK